MILKKVTLINFLSHADSEVEFNPTGITAIIGENGSGKSSIVEAVQFALFGKSDKGKLEQLIKWGKKESRVDLEFENLQGTFRIVRELSKIGKGDVQSRSILYKFEGSRLVPYLQKNLDKELPRLTGLTRKSFQTSGLIKQGEIEGLLSQKPKEREKIIEELLGIQYYQRLIQEYNENRKGIKDRLQILQDRQINTEDLLREIEEKRVLMSQLDRQIEEVGKEIKNKREIVSELTENLKTLQIITSQINSKLQLISRVDREISDLSQEMEKIQNLKEKLPEVSEEYRRYGELENRLNTVQELEAALNRKDIYIKLLEQLREDREFIQSYRETARKFEELQRKERDISRKIENINQLINSIEKNELERKSLEKALSEIKREVEFLNSYKNKAQEYQQKQARLNQISSELKILNQRRGQLGQMKASTQSIEDQMKKRKVELLKIAELLKTNYHQKFQTLQLNPNMIDEFINQNEIKLNYLEEEKSKLQQEIATLKSKQLEHKERLEKLSSIDVSCPVCGKPLTEHEKEELFQEIKDDMVLKEEEYKEKSQKLKEREEEIKKQREIRKFLENFKSTYSIYSEKKLEKDQLSSKMKVIEHSISKLESIEKEKHQIEEELSREHGNYGRYQSLKEKGLEMEVERLEKEIESVDLFLKENRKEDLLKRKEELLYELERIREFLSKNTAIYGKYRYLDEERIDKQITTTSRELKSLERRISQFSLEVGIEGSSVDMDTVSNLKNHLKSEANRIKNVQEEFFNIKREIAKEEAIKEELKKKNLELKKLKSELEGLRNSLTEIDEKDILLKKEGLERNIEILSQKYEEMVLERGKIEERLRILKDKLDDVRKEMEEIEALKDKLSKYDRVIETISRVNRAIKDNALYTLPKITEEIFSRFNFSHFYGLKFNEDYSIVLSVNVVGGETNAQIDALSGGQRISLALALRFAISKMLNNRIDFLILDEPTIHMDKHRKRELVDLVGDIKEKNFVKQLIVITHDEEIEERADTIYKVDSGEVELITV
ncbi:MAG: AAA family ATPase [Hydrogenothermaceae bacterium]|nr:AAA family ATPase [Hydrogenothermaceae bacterium]